MSKTVAIVPCTCKHSFQDATYGVNKRVANATAKGTGNLSTTQVRCTVCKTIHTVNNTTLKG